MKKGDFIIIGVVIAAIIASVLFVFPFSKTASRVVITQNNKIVYNQSIGKDNVVNTGDNVIVIENNIVYMQSANCKNQICVNSGKISKKGEKIVCLPNKVIVEIK